MAPAAINRKAAPIHFLYGSDEDAVKKAMAALAQKLAPSDAMNFEIIDGRADSADGAVKSVQQLREAILTLPFFGGGKLVWWKAVNFLEDSGMGRHASVKEALEELRPDLAKVDGTSVTLLISALGIHRGRTFSKALLKLAQAQEFELPDLRKTSEDEIIFQIERRLKGAGLQPGPGAAERFFQATGIDTAAWSQEIEKLACFLGEEKQLTREDVNRVISGSREVLVWDFCHAVLAGHAREALEQLSALLAQDESEVGILVLLAGQIRQAALAAVLRENKMLKLVNRGSFSAAEVSPAGEAYLPRKKSGEPISTYALGQVAQRSRKQPATFWFEALRLVYHAQREMLTGVGDKRRTLEWVVLEIVAGEGMLN